MLWAIVLMYGHVHDHFNALDVTRFALLAYVALFLLFMPLLRPVVRGLPLRTGAKYVLLSVVSAAVVEVAHIFSQPFSDSVKVTVGETTPLTALRNIALDLAVTLPAYTIVFTLVWRRLLSRWRYSLLEFVALISVAQFLGDGHIYVILNIAAAALFGPYVLMIYQLMNIPPYLLMRDEIAAARPARRDDEKGRYRGFWIVPATYWLYILVLLVLAVIGKVLWGLV
ncbi:MAG: hypothetical protein ACYDEB_05950 [Dehalococcoidia bacterium]